MTSSNLSREDTLTELKRLKSEEDFDGMLALAKQAVYQFPDDPKMWDIMHYAQAHYVNGKLESQIVKQLEVKKDWNSLAVIYQKLLTVFPESKQLKKLLKTVRGKIEAGHSMELKQFYSNAQNQILAFIEKGAYEEAIRACYELLADEPDKKEFIRLLAKAEKRLDDQMNRELETYYKEIIPALRAQYNAHKDQFIRI